MSAFQDTSGLLLRRYSQQQPTSAPNAVASFPFPGNAAVYNGIAPRPASSYAEFKPTAEFTQKPYFPQPCEILINPSQAQGASAAVLAQARSLFREGHRNSVNEIDRLKTMYRFKNDEAVQAFLSDHRAA